ncbi:hypothetical protein Hamer_G026109 [Homarus americanus]|uniref:Uncharacterized protein n=1 Tax=Homarus americanus TaxID=6706 RepID=A0A8J5NBD4_HOMAM|nr:hypothetical protein Hamer_G026109 [Homarus americanus]
MNVSTREQHLGHTSPPWLHSDPTDDDSASSLTPDPTHSPPPYVLFTPQVTRQVESSHGGTTEAACDLNTNT